MGVADWINLVPGIEEKSYLELGVARGATFDHVRAARKTGVDSQYATKSGTFYQTTTDLFFSRHAEGFWDVIYIDADHSIGQVVRDYNNACMHLAPGGLLFMHDLLPPSEEYTVPEHCGDAYKLLINLHEKERQFFVTTERFGLTMLPEPGVISTPRVCLGYSDLPVIPLYDKANLKRIMDDLLKR